MDEESGKVAMVPVAVVRATQLPFDHLPNLPRPVIPRIDLGLSRVDVLAIQPSLAPQRRVGYLLTDRGTQTEDSEILPLKGVTHILETLTQDVAQLRKDLNFAQNVLRADYESRLTKRATELYCRVNERMCQLEKQHHEKVEIVRRSYRSLLANAVQKIAGEYKAYYDELQQGKTGRHDLKIKELKERVLDQELQLQEQVRLVEDLMAKLRCQEGEGPEEDVPPPLLPGITLEEADELRSTIDQLEGEITELQGTLAAKEDANSKLTRQCDSLTRQVEDERGKVVQLKRDMEAFKKKTKSDQERASRMAENQMATLQREMAEKMDKAEKEATRRASEEAIQQRARDQARLNEELERRKSMEEDMRAQQLRAQEQAEKPAMEGDVYATLERLQRVEQQQREEIQRLHKHLDRSNRVWEMKLAIMQRNFHSLRNECFLRNSLHRQAATLHHATVGYAVSNPRDKLDGRRLRPLPQINSCGSSDTAGEHARTATGNTELSSADISLALPPPPSPLHSVGRAARPPSSSRGVHFGESPQSPQLSQTTSGVAVLVSPHS